MDNPKNQIATRVKESSNVLVTVSNNPSVDQLAAAIGLTLLLNKLGKHAAAVFSGDVPSTLEFLRPEETLEKTTDSLRDFIIALDKSKADKLRYKVEDKLVKIFITPYRTSIGQEDLEFSQGDFNVDVVIGLGVKAREDLDEAITAHGRILHDATVVSINITEAGNIGSINWVDAQASSLCEMVVALADMLKSGTLDEQMSTALLTGIVAETERFSNAKTTSITMSASAKLMAAGANQQLVATQLQQPEVEAELESEEQSDTEEENPAQEEEYVDEDGSLQIDHGDNEQTEQEDAELPEPQDDEQIEEINIDDQGNLDEPEAAAEQPAEEYSAEPAEETPEESQTEESEELPQQELGEEPKIEPESRHLMLEPPLLPSQNEMPGYEDPAGAEQNNNQGMNEPPSLNSPLTASGQSDPSEPPAQPPIPSSLDGSLLSHDSGPAQTNDQSPQPEPPAAADTDEPQVVADDNQTVAPSDQEDPTVAEIEDTVHEEVIKQPENHTLREIERSVNSSHLNDTASQSSADAVTDAQDLDRARNAVQEAMQQANEPPFEPIAALNAQPVDLDLGHDNDSQNPVNPPNIHIDTEGNMMAHDPANSPIPAPETPAADNNAYPANTQVPPPPAWPPADSSPPDATNSTAPPPVPPPMMPPMPPTNSSFSSSINPFAQPPTS